MKLRAVDKEASHYDADECLIFSISLRNGGWGRRIFNGHWPGAFVNAENYGLLDNTSPGPVSAVLRLHISIPLLHIMRAGTFV